MGKTSVKVVTEASRFFGPLFENARLTFFRNKLVVHERRPKHEKLKNVNPQQPSHISPPPPPFHFFSQNSPTETRSIPEPLRSEENGIR